MKYPLVLLIGIIMSGCSRAHEKNIKPVVFVLHRDGQEMKVSLKSDYGMVFSGSDGMTYLYETNRPSIRTNDDAVVTEFINRIRIGGIVDFPSTCTVSLSYGFDDDKISRAFQLIRQKGVVYTESGESESHLTLCYCESKGYSLAYDVSLLR